MNSSTNPHPSGSRMNYRMVIALAAFCSLVMATVALARDASLNRAIPRLGKKAMAVANRPAEMNRANSAQPDAVTNASNYTFATTTSGTFTNMTGSTQLIAAGQDDAASANTPIGFDFWLQGVRYTQFNATSNGFVGLSSTGGTVSGTTYSVAGGTAALPLISGCGGDEETAATVGKVHYKLTGVAPNRILTIEFLNMTIVYSAVTPEADGTFQVRLYETTGQVEFVYGPMMRGALTGAGVGNSGNLGIGYSVATANGSLVSIISATNTATTTTPFTQQAYPTGSIANLDSPGGDGTRRVYSLTPSAVTAPTSLTFSAITPIAMVLNWIDSPDETNYGIYRSTDNVNFTFVGTAALNATSFNATGLSPNTNYFWQVRAISDGTVGTALAGSQATSSPGVVTSTAAGGNWSDTATWAGSVVPTNIDNVTIVGGATVTVDVTSAVALNVNVQSGGTLQYIATPASTLTLGLSLTIDSGGTVTAGTGSLTTHVLSIGGDLTNNGTLDLFTTAGVGLTFTGTGSNTFGGTGATTDIRTMTLTKGANTNVLEMNPTNFTVQGVNTDVAGFLTLTSGTLKVSGNFTIANRTFAAAAYTIPATGGFWLNNPNYTVSAQTGNGTVNGVFRLSQGTYNVGTATGNSLILGTTSTVVVEGGSLTASGRVGVSAATNAVNYTQTGGTITVCTVGNATNNVGNFDLGTNAASLVTMSGGTIIIQLHATGTGTIDYRYDADPTNLTGTVVQLGNASSGAAKAFNLRGVLPNLVITNTSANHTATFNNTLVNFYHVITGNITINTGNTLSLAGDVGNSELTFVEGNILNNGTLNASNVNMSMQMVGVGTQTYSGTGIMTAPTTDMDIDGGGVDFTGAVNQQVIARVNLFTGSITGADKITLGNGGATAAFIQVGNGGPPALATGLVMGTIVSNAGSGGYSVFYGDTTTDRSTGGEIPAGRSVTNLTFDTEGANLTLAGGDLTVTGAMTLGDAADVSPNGRIITGANTMIVGSGGTVTRVGGGGHVDGNFRKTFAVAGSQTFEVGSGGVYSPALINATVGTFPAPLTVKATGSSQPNYPGVFSALKRYWTITDPTGLTADNPTAFTYVAGDVVGSEAAYQVARYSGGSFSAPASTVNTGTHVGTLTGASAISGDWTLFETDSDFDGMPDAYESAHGLNPNDPSDAATDFDSDGQSNFAEYAAGTDPQNASSRLAVTSTAKSGGQIVVTFNAVANKTYRLQYKALITDATWLDVGVADVTPGSTGPAQITDTTLTSQTTRVYQVEVVAP